MFARLLSDSPTERIQPIVAVGIKSNSIDSGNSWPCAQFPVSSTGCVAWQPDISYLPVDRPICVPDSRRPDDLAAAGLALLWVRLQPDSSACQAMANRKSHGKTRPTKRDQMIYCGFGRPPWMQEVASCVGNTARPTYFPCAAPAATRSSSRAPARTPRMA